MNADNQEIISKEDVKLEQDPEEKNTEKSPVILKIDNGGQKNPIIKWLVLAIAVIVLVFLSIGIIIIMNQKNKEPESKGRTEITSIGMVVKETINVSSLKTAEYTFNGVAKWFETNEKGKTERIAYVSYSGLVRYGIDFSKIRIEEEDNLIVIRIPALEKKLTVDPNQMKCIFTESDHLTTLNAVISAFLSPKNIVKNMTLSFLMRF